jgi:phosphatidate phosphatase APP1
MGDTKLQNLARFYRRMASDEVPGARLVACHGERELEVMADDEGYFQCQLDPLPPLDDAGGGLHAVELQLRHPRPAGAGEPSALPIEALVMIPAASARFGIISDIDDTVVMTHVRRRLKMLLTLARTNAHTRQPFKGVAAFYRALQAGAGGDDGNPIFYVSSSPWNLYTPLIEYLQVQDIPLGPLLLKDYGDHSLFALRDHHTHKQASIERLFETYPTLPFVLIGDSGEHDPQIYAQIAARHPGRVLAIYIRSLPMRRGASPDLEALIEQVRDAGSQMLLADDSVSAAEHAAGLGLIAPSALVSVRADRLADQVAPPGGAG